MDTDLVVTPILQETSNSPIVEQAFTAMNEMFGRDTVNSFTEVVERFKDLFNQVGINISEHPGLGGAGIGAIAGFFLGALITGICEKESHDVYGYDSVPALGTGCGITSFTTIAGAVGGLAWGVAVGRNL